MAAVIAKGKGLRVTGIYSTKLIEGLKNPEISNEKALLNAAKAEAASREERKRLKQNAKDAKDQQNLEDTYLKIRDTAVAQAFGTTLVKLSHRRAQLKELNEKHKAVIGEDNSLRSLTNELQNTEGVYNGAVGATKRDRKDTAKAGVTAAVGIGSAVAGMVSPGLVVKATGIVALFTANPIFGVLSIGTSVASLVYMAYKYAKRKQGNVSDEFAKGDALAKDIEEYLDKVNAFTQAIDADKEMIKDKIKTLGRKEFKDFLKEYLSEKIKTFNLTAEDFKANDISEVFEEFKAEPAKVEQKDDKNKDKTNGGKKINAEELAAMGG